MAKPLFILQIDFNYCHCIYTSNPLWSGPRMKERLSLTVQCHSLWSPTQRSLHNSAHSADSWGWNRASLECICGEEQVLKFSYTWIETVNWMHLPCSHSKFIQHTIMLFITLIKYAYYIQVVVQFVNYGHFYYSINYFNPSFTFCFKIH